MGFDESEDHRLEDIAAQLHHHRPLARRAALFQAMSPAVPSWRSITGSLGLLALTFGTFLLWVHDHNPVLLVVTLVLFGCVMLPITVHTRRSPPTAPPR